MAGKYIETQNLRYPIKVSDRIARFVVDEFCSVCDSYKKGVPCFNRDFDQKRYALRNWCDWARIGGVGVQVTLDVVIAKKKEYPRNDRSK